MGDFQFPRDTADRSILPELTGSRGYIRSTLVGVLTGRLGLVVFELNVLCSTIYSGHGGRSRRR